MKIHVFLVMAICFFENSKMQRILVPKPTHLKMNLNIHINTTEFVGNRKVEKYATSTKLNKRSRIESRLSRSKFSYGVAKDTKDVSDECKSFLKTSSHHLIKDTKLFDCIATDNSVRKDCGRLIKIKKGEPWYATNFEEGWSKIGIYFYRTLMISRIDLEQLGGEWLNEIKLSLDLDDRPYEVITLTKGKRQFWKSIKIDPPSCTTNVMMYLQKGNYTSPINMNKKRHGIIKIQLHGARVNASCMWVQPWQLPFYWDGVKNRGKSKAMECDDEELCIPSSKKCAQGCQHSDQCNDDEYCNVNTYQCRSGELKCGKLLKQSSTRIVNGEESAPHSRPWMVAIGSCDSCAGTLITDRHVLTAAHCVEYGVSVVLLGKHDCRKKDLGQMSVKIKKPPHTHPRYWIDEGKELSAYDIAVLTLEKPVRFSSTILPACLPYQSSRVHVNKSATAAGWGLTWGTGNQYRLREVDLTILPMKTCQSAKWIVEYHEIKNISKGVNLVNESHALCAGRYKDTFGPYNYTGVQSGDSGSHLILKDKETGLSTVIGVAMLSPRDSEYGESPYFIYSDVKQVIPWILDIIKV